MSVRKGNDVLAGGIPLRVDSSLNVDSSNPIQNGAVARALQTKADAATTYTKTEVDEALTNKQDNISAGDGITIADNTVAVGNLDCGTMS